MRFFYLDPGLQNDVGHHANSCRVITSEMRRRGIEVIVASSVNITPVLKHELGAWPLFSFYTYRTGNGEPIAGWISVFLQGVAITTGELAQLPATTAEDVVYVNSALPAQLMSIISWLHNMPAKNRPRVVIEFGTRAGVESVMVGDKLQITSADPRHEPRSVLYRYAGLTIPDALRKHLVLMTFDPMSSQEYEFIIGHKIGVLPLPQGTYRSLRHKVGKRPIVVGVLGHQRPDKGYEFVPEVISTVLSRHRNALFLVHNATPNGMPATQRAIRRLAGSSHRITLDERPADERIWKALFAATDIVLCPYTAAVYRHSYSAIAVEALANGVPMVAPAATSLSRFAEQHDGAVVTFPNDNAEAIASATLEALDNFDKLADTAFSAATTWNRQDRKALLVDCILGRA